jgi:hypothetical protein
MNTKKNTPTATGPIEAEFGRSEDAAHQAALARMAVRPSTAAAAVMTEYTKYMGGPDAASLADALTDRMLDLDRKGLRHAENMLLGQAHALQSMFTTLARRARDETFLAQWEACLRMALKAQNQCRMTLETLATIKNPPLVYAKQANIAHGPQQVNNGVPAPTSDAPLTAPATNSKTEQNKLLEASHGTRLDIRKKGKASAIDPQLETVGKIRRPAKR